MNERLIDYGHEHITVVDHPDQHTIIADALQAHDYDDTYNAYLCAAIEETKDVQKAVEIADAAFAKQPKLDAEPQEDDADALFAQPKE